MTEEQFERFERPFDMPVLAAASKGWFNILHMCGPAIHFDRFADYPATVFSWATTPGNPSLGEVHARTGKAVLGGLPAKPMIKSMSREALLAEATDALREMGGRNHLLGPGCSINPDTPEILIDAVGETVRACACGAHG
jgi:uroporphyrinogen decarboxylase